MCNEYELETHWEEYTRIMAREASDAPAQQSEFDLSLSPRIRIGDMAPVVRVAGNGLALNQMIFGFPPPRNGAGKVFNFRSEGWHFADSAVPAISVVYLRLGT